MASTFSSTAVADGSTGSTGGSASNGNDNYSSRPKTEVELAAEKLYEERMEDEYAKREGGA